MVPTTKNHMIQVSDASKSRNLELLQVKMMIFGQCSDIEILVGYYSLERDYQEQEFQQKDVFAASFVSGMPMSLGRETWQYVVQSHK